MTTRSSTRTAIDEFAASVRARFGPRIAALALFGSQARGDASEDSDVDILVVIDDLSQEDAREIDALVGDILTQSDVLLSPLVMGTARWRELRARERRLVAEIDREGVPL
jgi:uncharacterized protein